MKDILYLQGKDLVSRYDQKTGQEIKWIIPDEVKPKTGIDPSIYYTVYVEQKLLINDSYTYQILQYVVEFMEPVPDYIIRARNILTGYEEFVKHRILAGKSPQ